MRTPLKAAVALLIAAPLVALAWGAIVCPLDSSGMYYTGQSRFDMGKLLKLYKCGHGHTTWLIEE